MRKIQDANLQDQKVLLRVDFNVAMENGKIENDKRIRETLPTIQYLLQNQVAEIIIISHLGKPDGKFDKKLSLLPVANHLAKLLGIDIKFDSLQEKYILNSHIILLENLRFNKGEENNDSEFARSLACQGSLYVNDAFGTCHRAHASTAGVARILPAYAGLLVQKEVAKLERLLRDQEKPFVVILGGAKISDKLPVIKNFATRADNFLIGGAIANTFLAARRHYLGKSLVEKDSIDEANQIWQNLIDEPERNLYLPKDLIISKSIDRPEDVKNIDISELLTDKYPNYMAVDIGSKTIEEFKKIITQSKTIFWNGNMGISEVEDFANGTVAIAESLINLAKENPDSQIVIGGGDTVAAVENILSANHYSLTPNLFLSTGGGATLEFLAGKELPGLEVLE